MTTARVDLRIDPRDADIAAEIRADMARKRINQTKVAVEVFGRNQQWLSRRLLAEVAFTPSELIDLGDYMGINIVDWLNAAKHGPTTPTSRAVFQAGAMQPTRRKVDAKGLAPVIPLRPRAAA